MKGLPDAEWQYINKKSSTESICHRKKEQEASSKRFSFEPWCLSEQAGELASSHPRQPTSPLKHHTLPWAIPPAPPIRATVLERASGRVGITPANSPAPQAPYSPLGNTPGPPLLACPTAGPKSHASRRPASSSPRTRPPSTSHSSASSSQAATR